MTAKTLENLIDSVLVLAGRGERPRFYILDEDGRTIYMSDGAPPNTEVEWRVDDIGDLHAMAPPGWVVVQFPFDIYGIPDGFICAVVPAGEAAEWEKLVEEVFTLENQRRLNEFEVSDLAGAIVRHHEEINLLLEVPKNIHLGLETAEFFNRGLEQTALAARARRAMVVQNNRKGGYQVVALWEKNTIVRSDPAEGEDRSLLGMESDKGITGQAIREGRLIIANDLSESLIPLASFEQEAKSLMVIPLVSQVTDSKQADVLGALVFLGRIDEVQGFRSEDAKMTELIACQMANMMGNRQLSDIRKEVNIAANLQKSLLPARDPDLEGFDITGRCEPARYVGGDYYDYLPLQGKAKGCLVLDVSGHNLASALMLPMARAALTWMGKWEANPARILAEASSILHGNLAAAELFLTLFMVVIEPGNQEIKVANAGHNPPLLFRAAKQSVEWLDVDGPLVGLLPEPEHAQETFTMEEGDILVLYTDGVTEATNDADEMFGEERLADTIWANADKDAKGILEELYSEVRRFGDVGQDDVTVMVIKKT